MPLAVGSRLGHYDVTALIGEGGMGQVYQATDTKLNRQVALKILPEAFATDPDRLARFQREAQVLASLNHPNIAQIHGLEESDGTRALVLELVDGPTLADRIAQGPIPLDEALPIAKQIAEALEAAHEAGVIHRDLKPANIKVKHDGTVKVLDFGLAKAMQPDASDSSMSQSPTISLTAAATQMGMVIGTAAYMAPEQAKGKVVDKRADVWAFGVVLYEMLTGARPFSGDDVSETLARVIDREPNWDTLPDNVPLVLGHFLRGCLQKNLRQRIRDIGDVSLALEGAFESASQPAVAKQPLGGWRLVLPWSLGMLGLGSLVAVLVVWSVGGPSSSLPSRFRVTAPGALSVTRGPRLIEISPDGRTLVYAGDQLYRRDLSQLDWQPIPGTENAVVPVFSPDGQRLAFESDGLKTVPVGGGPVVTILEGPLRGLSWGPNDTIVFNRPAPSGLFRVSAAGGVPEPLTNPALDEDAFSTHHTDPEVLPSGESALFTVVAPDPIEGNQIAVVSLASGQQRILLQGDVPRYVSTGHILFVRENAIWAVPFDADTLEVGGSPVPVLEDVRIEGNSGQAQVAISDDGTLVFLPRNTGDDSRGKLVFVDRAGEAIPLSEDEAYYRGPRFSPDGARIAVASGATNFAEQQQVWVWDVERGGRVRLTSGARHLYPLWNPEGTQVAFSLAGTGAI